MKIAAIGECMIEMRHHSGSELSIGYGGDTLNTALYLARLLPESAGSVDYVTALGQDPYSDAMLAMWKRENIGTGHVRIHPTRRPGLYTIHTDRDGERSFYYWRSDAAVRTLFDDVWCDEVTKALGGFDWIYFSGITLSLFQGGARDRFRAALASARKQGTRIAFDLNFRAAGWPDLTAARALFDAVWPETDLLLPSFDDLQAVYDFSTPEKALDYLTATGVPEIVVKSGPAGVWIHTEQVDMHRPARKVDTVVDTTAAGDSFNAAYLAARLQGKPPEAAVEAGHRLAAAVIGTRGAIMPREQMPA